MNQVPRRRDPRPGAQGREARAAGTYLGPLHGITIGLKDIYLTEGKVTEGNSKLYTGFVPGFDADVGGAAEGGRRGRARKGRHERAGDGDRVGRRTTRGTCSRTPGGSSSGSAAGVGASEFMVGMGTCTGGSIRGPAANVGISGFKPTYGTISLHGIFPLAWSMDHPGPLTHSALDCALVVDAHRRPGPEGPVHAAREEVPAGEEASVGAVPQAPARRRGGRPRPGRLLPRRAERRGARGVRGGG